MKVPSCSDSARVHSTKWTLNYLTRPLGGEEEGEEVGGGVEGEGEMGRKGGSQKLIRRPTTMLFTLISITIR